MQKKKQPFKACKPKATNQPCQPLFRAPALCGGQKAGWHGRFVASYDVFYLLLIQQVTYFSL
jgi:hypothetical protein